MKRVLIIPILLLLLSFNSYTQTLLKNAADTAFLLDHVYYPQLQIKLSISFLTSDFAAIPKKRMRHSEIDSLKRIINKEPANGDHLMALATVYNEFCQTHKTDSIRDACKDIFINNLVANAADTHAIRMLANIYLGEMQWKMATSYYEELTRRAPASSSGWGGLAMIDLASYDFKNAMMHMQKALDAEPDKLDNYSQMANIITMKSVYDLDKYDSTIMDTLSYKGIVDTKFLRDALKKKPGDPSLLAMLDALTLTAIIYETFIDNSREFTGRGDTIHFKLSSNCEKAIAEIEKRMTSWTTSTFHDREFPYTCLMLIEFLRNNPDKALTWFNKGVKYNPRSQSLYENMTGISALGAHKETAYRMQLKLDSIRPTYINFLMTGYFYYLDKNYDASEQWTEKVLSLTPSNFDAIMGMAAICIKKMKLPGAALFLKQASDINAEYPDVILLTGILYILDNSPQMAKTTLDALLKNVQDNVDAADLIKRFLK